MPDGLPIPIIVRPCAPDSWLGAIQPIDLVGLSESAARDALVGGLFAAWPEWTGSPRRAPGRSGADSASDPFNGN
ncbi:hypothetical protein I6A60_09320 [Frankia sp. AgB1.9]|uniref:hypothetical protein n=1 Tax=unclassified Frankia TaxID=2632575 RepID=UPI001931D119|nr:MULTISPECIES: hypothetical protein [unclassified Frankia]MBL7489472.1 hypothetical protein [Frankia sp. AgW1.1]MBL7548073.1 hypothetical protein [Frankia sp. AgB1.9]MBL7617942.1 hypothetical protein [Frankia sp. AgB1.8]